ncbi:MAG TPA: T9SS type A sorting domain-containing protein [Bacteroidia bacterium]|nr:T9SS type A sorting domain-containing protein [Bacteroidia bacterium]
MIKKNFLKKKFAGLSFCMTLICLLTGNVNAQVAAYTFASASETYAAISGTTAFSSGYDDGNVTSVPIGFAFVFNGTSYTTCTINANGYITFGTTAPPGGTPYTPISDATSYSGAIAAYGRDIQAQNTAPLGNVQYTSSGGVFTVQWTDARRYNSSITNAERINMQIKLFQTTNVIKIIYGTWSDAVSASSSNNGQIGLRGITNADFKNLGVLSGGNWSSPAAGATNNATCYYNQNSTATKPASGQAYTFTPPSCTSIYAAFPYSESFESWVNCLSTNDNPTSNWKNSPATGNNSWRKNNQGTSAGWSSTSGGYTPSSTAGSFSARFHSYDATSGSQGSLDLYLNCSTGNASKHLTFDYINTSGSDVLAVLLSTDGGNNFIQLGNNLTTATGWTVETFSFSSTSATTVIRFRATSDFGVTDIGVDNLNITESCTPVFAALPYSESFESWINCTGITDVPGSSWKNTPVTGNNSWRKNNQGASAAWSGTSGGYIPTSSKGSYSARFHSYDAVAGSQGSLDLYINCSAGGAGKFLTFDYINGNGSDVLAVLISTNGGNTFTQTGSNLTAATSWTVATFGFTSTSATTVIRLRATSDFGTTDIGIDNINVGASCIPVYAAFPYSQNFESWVNCSGITDAPSASWKNTPAGGNNSWRRNDQGASAAWSGSSGGYSPASTSGSFSARFHSYDATSGSQGSLDLYIDCSTGGAGKQVTFDYVNKSGSDVLAVFLSTNGGTNFSQLETNLTIASAWTPQAFSFSSTSATTVIRLRATSDFGVTDIGVDNLNVITGLAANDQCSAAVTLSCGSIVNSSTASATTAGETGLPVCAATTVDAPGVWYKITGTGNAITASTCGGTTNYDTRLHVYSGTCASLVNTDCNNDACGLQSTVTWNSIAGTVYYILVNGSSNSTGLFTLTISCAGDNCATATPLACDGSVSGNTTAAGNDTGFPSCPGTGNNSKGLWHSITATGTGNLTLSLCGTAWDTYLRVFSGTCGAMSCVANNNDGCSTASTLTFSATTGVTYYVLVTGTGAAANGPYTLTSACPATTPTITDFTPASGCEGTTVTINGVLLSGATIVTIGGTPVTSIVSNTTTQIVVVAGNGTTGTISATTPLGTGTSSQTFTMFTPPVPDASSNAPVCEGSGLFLFGNNLAAGQTTGNTYSWSGPNNFTSSLQNASISGASPANGGMYSLAVTNVFGCSASTTTSVSVNPNPVLSIASQTSACDGANNGSVDIDATSGTPPFLFDLDGNATLDGIYTGLASGSYNISVIDDNGCENSISVTITETPSPTALVSGSGTICSGDSVNVHLVFTGASPWNYTLSDGTQNINGTSSVSPADIKIVPNAAGSHSYSMTVLADANCSSGTATGTVPVTVNSKPGASITTAGPTTFCSGTNPLTLTANPGTGYTYQWKKGANNIAGATGQSYVPTATANSYKVIVTNPESCSSLSAGIAVTVNALPAATITPQGPTTFCAGDSIVLQANTGTGLAYQWKKGGGSIGGATLQNYTAKTGGTYRVIVTNANTCSRTSAGTIITVNCRLSETLIEETTLEVFPNPANGRVTVIFNSKENQSCDLKLMDVTGRVVMQEQLTLLSGRNEHIFDLSSLAKGLYLVKILAPGGEMTEKILKE